MGSVCLFFRALRGGIVGKQIDKNLKCTWRANRSRANWQTVNLVQLR